MIVLEKYGFPFYNHHRFPLLNDAEKYNFFHLGYQSYTARTQSFFIVLVTRPSS